MGRTPALASRAAILRARLTMRATTFLRYRWNAQLARWEFYGYGSQLWRQSFVYTRDFPPPEKYHVRYADTMHELAEL
jgi:hypothetical protein